LTNRSVVAAIVVIVPVSFSCERWRRLGARFGGMDEVGVLSPNFFTVPSKMFGGGTIPPVHPKSPPLVVIGVSNFNVPLDAIRLIRCFFLSCCFKFCSFFLSCEELTIRGQEDPAF